MALMHYTARVTEDRLLELPVEVQQELQLEPGQEIEIQLQQSFNLVPGQEHFYFAATPEQFRAALDELAQMNRGLPMLADHAFDRETIYEDRL